jgi:hypothetical protein
MINGQKFDSEWAHELAGRFKKEVWARTRAGFPENSRPAREWITFVCEGQSDKEMLAAWINHLAAERSVLPTFQIIVAGGKELVPTMAGQLSRSFPVYRTVPLMDADGDMDRTRAIVAARAPEFLAELIIASPSVEAWAPETSDRRCWWDRGAELARKDGGFEKFLKLMSDSLVPAD